MRRELAWTFAAGCAVILTVLLSTGYFDSWFDVRPSAIAARLPQNAAPKYAPNIGATPSSMSAPKRPGARSPSIDPSSAPTVAASADSGAAPSTEAEPPIRSALAELPSAPSTPNAPGQMDAPAVPLPPRKPAYTLDQQIHVAGFARGAPIFIRVFKESREMEIWMQDGLYYRRFKTYPICAYSGDLGPKLQEGDGQSPEGFYTVSPGAMNPNSSFHLSFNIGFPNAYDRSHGRTGSFLMVHGACVSAGCYAMTNDGIEEIYALAERAFAGGQQSFPIHIFPFRMTEANLAAHVGSPWAPFWENLREGYDVFERDRVPPLVDVQEHAYVFAPTVALAYDEGTGIWPQVRSATRPTRRPLSFSVAEPTQ